MRFAIMGAGGVGGYYGAQLAQAGNEVTFVARGDHLAAMQTNGLTIHDRDGDFTLNPVSATDDVSSIGPVDAVLMCVKLYDTETAAMQIKPLLGPDSIVVTLQNGVEAPEIVEAVVGNGRTLGGATYISATIEAPGAIRRNNDLTRIEFGEPDGPASDRAGALAENFKAAGLDASAVDDMAALLWSKFVLLSANSGMTAMTRQTTGEIRADPVMRQTFHAALAETVAVGRARGVALPDNIEQSCTQWLDTNAPIKASLLVDLERGRRLEAAWLSGAVHRLGQEVGVPTPTHTTIFAALRPFADGSGS
ncbi:MAG: 2-dehydropantoate 2-reductase [Alphaproteobacteria bacterium]|nr:2-dehydropantoate 2-reductase [Alphaproteobacteria bacterium]